VVDYLLVLTEHFSLALMLRHYEWILVEIVVFEIERGSFVCLFFAGRGPAYSELQC